MSAAAYPFDPELLRNFTVSADGIWVGPDGAAVSYPSAAHDNLFRLEDESFWFRHRNECIGTVLTRVPPRGHVLDVGAGNGAVTKALQDAGLTALALEPNAAGARNARCRGVRWVLQSTFAGARFTAESLDAVGLFDVLEHVEEDHVLVEAVAGALRATGLLYLTVPAHPRLWSGSDVRAGHFRRYTARCLVELVTAAGFQVRFLSYFFSGLSLPIFCCRVLPYRLGVRRGRDVSAAARAFLHRRREGQSGRLLAGHWRRELHRLRVGTVSRGASLIMAAEKKAAG